MGVGVVFGRQLTPAATPAAAATAVLSVVGFFPDSYPSSVAGHWQRLALHLLHSLTWKAPGGFYGLYA
jgi:hypothetical protein